MKRLDSELKQMLYDLEELWSYQDALQLDAAYEIGFKDGLEMQRRLDSMEWPGIPR